MAGAIWFSLPIAHSWVLITIRQGCPIPSATWGDALGITVENRTKGDQVRGFVQPSPTAVPEGLSGPRQPVPSHTPVVWMSSGFVSSQATQCCRKCSQTAHSVFPEAVLWFQQPGCFAVL